MMTAIDQIQAFGEETDSVDTRIFDPRPVQTVRDRPLSCGRDFAAAPVGRVIPHCGDGAPRVRSGLQ